MERSVLKKKFIRALFWILLTYTALSSTIVLVMQFGLARHTSGPILAIAQSNKEEKATTPTLSESSFAEQFVREYLFWTKGREDLRSERLKPFFAPKADNSKDGFNLEKAKWNSYATFINVWSIKDREDGIKDVTVYAETVMTKIHNSQQQKRVNRYLVVPIQKAGESYVVVGTPYFIPPPQVSQVTALKKKAEKKGERINDKEYVQVENFTKSFFKVFTTGDAQEIGYYLKDKQAVASLTGILRFEEIRNLSAYQENNRVQVECDIAFEDLHSGAESLYHYHLDLLKEGKQWFVLKIEQGGR